MNEFKPALLRKTAKWRLTEHKNNPAWGKDAHSLDYKPRSRTIFIEDCKVESIEKMTSDREVLRKRRKQVDYLTLAKERAELMLFWATMKHKESEAIDIKEIDLMKTQNSLTLRVKNPSFKISYLKDEICRVVVAHRKTLSDRNPLQITEPIKKKT
jgi:hypothetical protein